MQGGCAVHRERSCAEGRRCCPGGDTVQGRRYCAREKVLCMGEVLSIRESVEGDAVNKRK